MAIGPGIRFDRYEILSLLGVGGMGEVYLANDTRLGRKIAIKALPAQYTADADRVRRFEQEARAASALNHPNIVTILDVGQVAGVHFMAHEYVEGSSLRQRMSEESVPLAEALEIAIQRRPICHPFPGSGDRSVQSKQYLCRNVLAAIYPAGVFKKTAGATGF